MANAAADDPNRTEEGSSPRKSGLSSITFSYLPTQFKDLNNVDTIPEKALQVVLCFNAVFDYVTTSLCNTTASFVVLLWTVARLRES